MRDKVNKTKNRKEDKKESEIVTKESFSASFALFSFIALLMLCTGTFMFGGVGGAVQAFLTGVFGYFAYPLALGGIYLSVMSLLGKRLVKNRKAGACVIAAVVLLMLIIHTVQTVLVYEWSTTGYLSACFYAGEEFPAATIMGWAGGLIVVAIVSLLSNVGAMIFFSALFAFSVYLCVVTLQKKSVEIKNRKEKKALKDQAFEIPVVNPAQEEARSENATIQGNLNRLNEPVSQRPGVRLPDEQISSQNAFSPFGAIQPRENGMGHSATDKESRAFLFGSSPAENYKRNLIFDPNSNANRRPAATFVNPTTDFSQPTVTGAYTPSYSNEYERSINEEQPVQPPLKVVENTDNGYNSDFYAESYRQEENVAQNAPSPSFVQPEIVETPTPQEPVSYPNIFSIPQERVEEPRFEYNHPVDTTGEQNARGFESVDNLSPDEGQTEYRRHDYMHLFSTSNPNVFGREEDNARLEEPLDRNDRGLDGLDSRSFEREQEEVSPFERTTMPDERTDRERDGLHLFDDEPEEENPYALRSDFEAYDSTRNIDSVPARETFLNVEEPARGTDRFNEENLFRNERASENNLFDQAPVLENRREETPATPPTASETFAPQKPTPPKPRVIKPYKRMSLDDLDCRDVEPSANAEEVEETKQNIIATLEDFKVTGASIDSVTFGPTVTRYNVMLPRNISPKKVVALEESIAISLRSGGLNIYPNYEDGVVSIEVPNKDRQFVQLGCMLSGDSYVNAKPSSLMFAMGKDVANRKIYGDISKMIHLLVAGASGSGKSVFLGALIISLIYKYSPEELRLILIDPKKTEFVLYNDLPHLMINEIITDVNKAVQSLNWAIGEMNRRYGLFEQMSRSGTYVVNLDQYNMQMKKEERLPKIVIIIDELADLMLAAKKDMEEKIQNLTQKARAAGIHLIVATQRPSTDVITGVIKSNLPTRVAFGVATDVDSRVILDQSGAQNLLGKGDFLYTMQGINTPVRVQSAFISPEESQKVVNYIKSNNEAYYDEEATMYINNSRGGSSGDSGGRFDKDNVEPVYIDALRYVILSGSASISMIQRKCSAGYNKAGKIIEWMEEMGYISAFDGAKARKVLITKDEFEQKYGPLQ